MSDSVAELLHWSDYVADLTHENPTTVSTFNDFKSVAMDVQ
jgi:hypothetical protein